MRFIKLTESKTDVDGEKMINSPVYINAELVYKVSPLSYQHSSSRLFFVGSEDTHIDVTETVEEIFKIMNTEA